MKKSTCKFNSQHLNIHSDENHKEGHFTYFQNLEHKLLTESEKLTSLISTSNTLNETQSLQNFTTASSCTQKAKPSTNKLLEHKSELNPFLQNHETLSSFLLQNYLQARKMEIAPKSQQIEVSEREKQAQRKLTYNLVHPAEQAQSEHSHARGKVLSPRKSDKMNENLKKTASSTSSAVLKTIDKIKKLHNLGTTTSKKPKSLSIQDFTILKYLQEGQFGAVYLASHNQTKMILALKKISKRIFEGEARYINQLLREIKIQSFLDHPNIVQLYGFFSDEEFFYLILQPCCGGNVYSNLKKEGRFPEGKVSSMLKQICHAIQFMHDNDIIHRDIKPQNILLHEGILKVCDFGWSIHSPLLRDTRCGTPLYSSPEVIQSQQYDNKVDIWNIGILTYQLLYGRVPFEIRKEEDLVKIVDQQICFPNAGILSNKAKEFILRCLHKNPKERLTISQLIDLPFILA